MTEATFNHPSIEMVPISSLKPNPNGAKKHGAKQIELIGTSLSRWGFLVPIVTDKDRMIVAGMGRYLAALERNYDHVPIVSRDFLSAADRRAFALAENRLAELGGWDDELLQVELKFLFDADYDLTVTGFELKDLDFSIGEVVANEEAVELPPTGAVAVSRPGDLWTIGDHRLYCGNSRDVASYEALLDGDRATMVFSDPPYNVRIDGHVSGLGAVKHREFLEASGELSPGEFTVGFLRPIFRNCVRYSADGSIHFHCMDWRHAREILDAADGVYSTFKQLVVWVKDNAGMGAFYRSRHELIFVFKSGAAPHTNNFGLGETRYRTNVWEYPGCNTFRKGRAEDLEAHATVKPLALVMDAILDCSNRGDIILDPFSGSGTTLLAAHKTGRRGAAIELDPIYVDTSIKRLCAASGLVARLPDGRSFTEVEADRCKESIGG